MARSRYIAPLKHMGSEKIRTIYHLTKKGLEQTKGQFLGLRGKFKSEVPAEHDLALITIGERPKTSSLCAQYPSENILQSDKACATDRVLKDFVRCRSDAYMEINFNGKSIHGAVEYERIQKQHSRFCWEDSVMKKALKRVPT